MTTLLRQTERDYLRGFMQYGYTGMGEVVDLGCWCGGGATVMAEGLALNRLVSDKTRRITAYDTFIWRGWMDEYKHLDPRLAGLKDGNDFADLAADVMRSPSIDVCIQDLSQMVFDPPPRIELMHIDVMKDALITANVARSFFPTLFAGATVIHQDFVHALTPWLHILMYRLRFYLMPAGCIPDSSSVVFRCIDRIPIAEVYALTRLPVSDEDLDLAFKYSAEIVPAEFRPIIQGARVMAMAQSSRLLAKAHEEFAKLDRVDPYCGRELDWVAGHLFHIQAKADAR